MMHAKSVGKNGGFERLNEDLNYFQILNIFFFIRACKLKLKQAVPNFF